VYDILIYSRDVPAKKSPGKTSAAAPQSPRKAVSSSKPYVSQILLHAPIAEGSPVPKLQLVRRMSMSKKKTKTSRQSSAPLILPQTYLTCLSLDSDAPDKPESDVEKSDSENVPLTKYVEAVPILFLFLDVIIIQKISESTSGLRCF
jgi:hypothetical protein